MIEDTIDVNKYKDPIKNVRGFMFVEDMAENIQFNANYFFDEVKLHTVEGILSEQDRIDYVNKLRVRDFTARPRLASAESIKQGLKYTYHGETFDTDFYMKFRFQVGNNYTEITRNYVDIVDCFSDIGGVFEFVTVGFAVSYS